MKQTAPLFIKFSLLKYFAFNGVQNMKISKMTCPYCGANLKIKPGISRVECEYCGSQVLVEDNDSEKNASHDSIHSSNDFSYKFEEGQNDAQRKSENQRFDQNTHNQTTTTGFTFPKEKKRPVKKKGNIFLWILGWIFVFPVPITILLLRNHKISRSLKIILIVISWLLYIGWISSSDSSSKSESSNKSDYYSVDNMTTDSISSENESDAEEQKTDSYTTTLFEIPTGFTDDYEEAIFEKFNSPAEENGLGNSLIWFEGVITTADTISGSEGSDQQALYYIIEQGSGNQWLCIMDVNNLYTMDLLEKNVGDTIVVTGIYQGFSNTYKKPVLLGHRIFDRSKGERFATSFKNNGDGPKEYGNCLYTVPEEWLSLKYNSVHMYYYPSSNDMMMVSIERNDGMTRQIWNNEKIQEIYYENVKKGYTDFELLEKENIIVDNENALRFKFKGVLTGAEDKGVCTNVCVVFPTKQALTTFSFHSFQESTEDYFDKFDSVIDSIVITNRATNSQ